MTTDVLVKPDSTKAPLAESRKDIIEHPLERARAEITTDTCLYSAELIGLPELMGDGGKLTVVGEVSLKGCENNAVDLALIKCDEVDGSHTLYVVGLNIDENGAAKAVPSERWHRLEANKTFSIGRAKPSNDSMDDGGRLFGHKFTDDISRSHIGLTLNQDTITIVDSSTNGSSYRGVDAEVDAEVDDYDYTAHHTATSEDVARLREQLKLDDQNGVELFGGRRTIGRDTFPIDGHVDIRAWVAGGEAIVVDSKVYPEEFDTLRAEFDRNLQDITLTGGRLTPSEADVLRAISTTVDQAMEYDVDFVDEESKTLYSKHRKAALNIYLAAGKGVCRHMALAVSWLGGDAVSRGLIKGRFTTEVNQSTKGNGAHEWSRFVSDSDPTDVYIIDVAQHFVGRLADTDVKSAGGEEKWGYFRDKAERDFYRRLKVAGNILPITREAVAATPNKIITADDVPKS